MTTTELQLEGLVGPTHNYAGLSFGNIASTGNANSLSSPRAAALQSLEKMKFVASLGVPVAIMPPHPRPRYDVLKRLGYTGSETEMLNAAWAESPDLAGSIWSASSMWSANAATVTPSCDASDGKTHFTPANLFSTLHRSIEPSYTTHLLRQIFADEKHFTVHDPLPVTTRLADEGAANHMRFCDADGQNGHHVFVYGAAPDSAHFPTRFPARQQKAASEAVARAHQLNGEQVSYIQQTPKAIDAGVFHNDVIALSQNQLLVCHEDAFVEQQAALDALAKNHNRLPLTIRVVKGDELSLAEAVSSYFFNAQLLQIDGAIEIIFPQECAENPRAKLLCEKLVTENIGVRAVHFLNLRESMRNGGGPACLRLRVPLTDAELAAMHQGVLFNERLYQRLGALIEQRYPESLTPERLRDAAFASEMLELQQAILGLLGLK